MAHLSARQQESGSMTIGIGYPSTRTLKAFRKKIAPDGSIVDDLPEKAILISDLVSPGSGVNTGTICAHDWTDYDATNQVCRKCYAVRLKGANP